MLTDDEDDYEENGGSRLLGFMFGNVDDSGDLDVDYLDEAKSILLSTSCYIKIFMHFPLNIIKLDAFVTCFTSKPKIPIIGRVCPHVFCSSPFFRPQGPCFIIGCLMLNPKSCNHLFLYTPCVIKFYVTTTPFYLYLLHYFHTILGSNDTCIYISSVFILKKSPHN